MKALVTGGAGFIGSHLVRALIERGDGVRVLDDLSTGSADAVPEGADLVRGSLLDGRAPRRATEGVDVVFHLAALRSVLRSVESPLPSHEANATGTLKLLLAAREAGVKRVVVASSSSVYGANPALPRTEDLLPLPQSPYAASKLAAESYALAFHRTYGLPCAVLRYFNVYGPGQDPRSPYAAVVPLFLKALLSGKRPVIYGDGRQTRDFTYVSDCVRATLAAGEAKGAEGEVINVASGREVSVLELLESCREATGAGAEPVFEAPRKGEQGRAYASIEKARGLLGYEPRYDLPRGLAETVEWMGRGAPG